MDGSVDELCRGRLPILNQPGAEGEQPLQDAATGERRAGAQTDQNQQEEQGLLSCAVVGAVRVQEIPRDTIR